MDQSEKAVNKNLGSGITTRYTAFRKLLDLCNHNYLICKMKNNNTISLIELL